MSEGPFEAVKALGERVKNLVGGGPGWVSEGPGEAVKALDESEGPAELRLWEGE